MDASHYKVSDFTLVPIDDFITGTEVPVDLFIQLSENKFVQIAKSGERVQIERFLNYKSKEVTHFCIKNNEFSKYLNRGLTIAGIIVKNPNIALAQRQSTLTKIAGNVFSQIGSSGMSKEAFVNSKTIVSATISLVQAKPDLSQLMHTFAQFSNSLYAHSVAVSMISVMIGTGMHWKQALTIEKLGLGALLHDIGLKELPVELINKTRAEMTPEELLEYETHPYRGMMILRSLADIPDDVISIAYEHHENSLGMGYPRRIKQVYTNPLARVVALADEFCDLTMKSPTNAQPRSAADAISYIENVMGQPYWSDAFIALKQLIHGGKLVVEKKSA